MQVAQELLANEYKKRKARNPNYSLRAFARWLEISPAQLSQVISGKRPLTLKTFKKVSEKLELTPGEQARMIATTLSNKETSSYKSDSKKVILKEDEFSLISEWYHLAILSLANMSRVTSDPRKIASRLSISVEQAHQALLRLERLGIIETRPFLKQITPAFEAVSEVPSAAIRKYHKQVLNLATEKIETVPNQLRQFQSIAIPLSPKKIAKMKILIDDFLEQAEALVGKGSNEEIYFVNVQCYPVTTIKESV